METTQSVMSISDLELDKEMGLAARQYNLPRAYPSVKNFSVGDTVKVRIHQYDDQYKVCAGIVTDVDPFNPPSIDVTYLNIGYDKFSLETIVVLDDDKKAQVVACDIGRESTAIITAKKMLREKILGLEKQLQQAKEEGERMWHLFANCGPKDKLNPVM